MDAPTITSETWHKSIRWPPFDNVWICILSSRVVKASPSVFHQSGQSGHPCVCFHIISCMNTQLSWYVLCCRLKSSEQAGRFCVPAGNAKDGELFPRSTPAIVQVLSQLQLERTHYSVLKRSASSLVILKETSLHEHLWFRWLLIVSLLMGYTNMTQWGVFTPKYIFTSIYMLYNWVAAAE